MGNIERKSFKLYSQSMFHAALQILENIVILNTHCRIFCGCLEVSFTMASKLFIFLKLIPSDVGFTVRTLNVCQGWRLLNATIQKGTPNGGVYFFIKFEWVGGWWGERGRGGSNLLIKNSNKHS